LDSIEFAASDGSVGWSASMNALLGWFGAAIVSALATKYAVKVCTVFNSTIPLATV
jgi:hypothetical protein